MNESRLLADLAGACEEAARAGLLHGAVAACGGCASTDVLWAWGDASVEPDRRAMAVDAIFDVASVTKVVATATACGVCIDAGLLDPDAPASDYLPAIGRLDGDAIRVRDLATHTSGYDNRKFDSLGPAEMLEAMVRTPAQWPPAQRCEYSCRNFVVLGLMVEAVTGEDLASFCERCVFGPLGMKDTSLGRTDGPLERVVPTYRPPGVISDEQAHKAGRPVGNAGLFSTAADLAAFCRMMLNRGQGPSGRVLGDRALAWLTRPCSPPGLERRAFGWDMRPRAQCEHRPGSLSQHAIGHSGWTGQSVWIDPGRDLFTIVLTNRTHAPGDSNNYEASKRFRAEVGDLLAALRH